MPDASSERRAASRLGPMPLVIAHRGASAYAPEHTFASWDMAMEMRADFLEQDLQMTADGVLVVMHDPTLDRTTSGRGEVIRHRWDEVRELDAGSWFNRKYLDRVRLEFADERIHTLEEVFERYRDRAAFYPETKNPEEAPGMEEALLAVIDRFGLREAARKEWRVLIQSFSAASLGRIREMDPALPLIQLIRSRTKTRRIIADLPRIAEYAVGIGPSHRSVTPALVEAAHEAGLHVHPYTVNGDRSMRRMIDAGVDGIFTDEPDRLRGMVGGGDAAGPEAVAAAAEDWRSAQRR